MHISRQIGGVGVSSSLVPLARSLTMVAAVLFSGVGNGSAAFAQQTVVPLTPEQRSVASALESAFIRISDTVGPATVRITANLDDTPPPSASGDDGANGTPFGDLFGPSGPFQGAVPRGRQRGGQSVGSGAIIRPDGWIVTNDHVVEGAKDNRVKVYLSDNTSYTGRIFRDTMSDLAVVKIDAPRPLPYVKIADSGPLRVGQWAIAIGSPFSEQNTMTTGIVSALHRSRSINDESVVRYYPNLIQTDAAINPGNSGGPLLNIDGELIGVNVAILSRSGASAGVGFAIPANTVKMVADQLIATGKVTRATLGLIPTDIPAFLRQRIGTDKGAYVGQVAPETPADKAGIQPGDVITRFADKPIDGEITLRDAIGSTAPGASVSIALLRNGKPLAVTAKLEARKDTAAPETPAPAVRRPAREFGINATELTPDIVSRLKLKSGVRGVAVAGVTSGSPAEEAGLARGSVITAVNGTVVTSVDALNRAMASAKSGDIITLNVVLPSDAGRAVVNIQAP